MSTTPVERLWLKELILSEQLAYSHLESPKSPEQLTAGYINDSHSPGNPFLNIQPKLYPKSLFASVSDRIDKLINTPDYKLNYGKS